MQARETSSVPAKHSILTSALPGKDWEALIKLGKSMQFEKGQTIISQGTTGRQMYLIQKGRVEVSVTSMDGQKGILNHMGAGEVLGEIAVLDGGTRSADAVAVSDGVKVIAFERADVLRFLQGSPDVVASVIRELCRRVRNASDMFEVKSEKSARVRLARALLRLSAKWGQSVAGKPDARALSGFSQSDLGDYAGLARENVNRQLKSWEDEGLIALSKTGMTLLDLDAIADQAQL